MSRKRKASRRRASPVQFVRPTEEREMRNQFRTAGAAYRVVPVIETLLKTERINQAEFDALDYYRDQANKAQDDARQPGPLDPERIMGGGGGSCTGGRIPAIMLGTPAIIETSRIERDVGSSLLPVLQAVARDNMSLSAWCIAKYGGRERYNGDGAFVAIVPIAEKRVMTLELLDLRYAAGAITRAFDTRR